MTGKIKNAFDRGNINKVIELSKIWQYNRKCFYIENTKETRLKPQSSILLSLMGKDFCNTILRKNKRSD